MVREEVRQDYRPGDLLSRRRGGVERVKVGQRLDQQVGHFHGDGVETFHPASKYIT